MYYLCDLATMNSDSDVEFIQLPELQSERDVFRSMPFLRPFNHTALEEPSGSKEK